MYYFNCNSNMKVYVNITYCVAWNGREGFPPTSKRANKHRDEDPRYESSTLNLLLVNIIAVGFYIPTVLHQSDSAW